MEGDVDGVGLLVRDALIGGHHRESGREGREVGVDGQSSGGWCVASTRQGEAWRDEEGGGEGTKSTVASIPSRPRARLANDDDDDDDHVLPAHIETRLVSHDPLS